MRTCARVFSHSFNWIRIFVIERIWAHLQHARGNNEYGPLRDEARWPASSAAHRSRIYAMSVSRRGESVPCDKCTLARVSVCVSNMM